MKATAIADVHTERTETEEGAWSHMALPESPPQSVVLLPPSISRMEIPKTPTRVQSNSVRCVLCLFFDRFKKGRKLLVEENKTIIEGLLFAVGEDGLSLKEIAEIIGISKDEVRLLLNEMQIEWKLQRRGMQIVRVAQVYQLTTLPEHAPYFERLAQTPARSQLSRAQLETLAIIAYRQPVTRMEIEEIRGVKSDRLVQILQRKGLVREMGRAEGLGRPILYGTTREFLEYFGFNHIAELPPPDSLLLQWQDQEAEPTELDLFSKKQQTNPEEQTEEAKVRE